MTLENLMDGEEMMETRMTDRPRVMAQVIGTNRLWAFEGVSEARAAMMAVKREAPRIREKAQRAGLRQKIQVEVETWRDIDRGTKEVQKRSITVHQIELEV